MDMKNLNEAHEVAGRLKVVKKMIGRGLHASRHGAFVIDGETLRMDRESWEPFLQEEQHRLEHRLVMLGVYTVREVAEPAPENIPPAEE